MTITLSQQAYWELLKETDAVVPGCQEADGFSRLRQYPQQLGQGYMRSLNLQPGLTLDIANYTLFNDVATTSSDRDHPLEYTFHLTPGSTHPEAERYGVWGSGLAPGSINLQSAHQRAAQISVHLEPNVFLNWLKLSEDELPGSLRSLIRRSDEYFYERYGTPLASMQMVLQQIWHCPYQGLTKRLYLESKVWELMTLVLDEVDSDAATPPLTPLLKPDDIDCIHHASQILKSRLDHPPSLRELARLIGINDHKLKLGFHQVFGTTVFGYLHELRLERSRQLLETGTFNVTEAARAVGFANRSHFAAAFRRRFGMNPSTYYQCSRP